MKKYISMTDIEAEFMERGIYCNLKGIPVPPDADAFEDGYYIRYPDGHETWLSKDIFKSTYKEANALPLLRTIPNMASDDYKKRFQAEFDQLKIRYDELKSMVEKWDKKKLDFIPLSPRSIYIKQLVAMVDYMFVLSIRAKKENIDIGQLSGTL